MKKPKNAKADTTAPKPRGRPPGSGKKAAAAPKPPKAAKEPKAPKAPKVPRADAIRAAAGDNSSDPQLRALFLHSLPKVVDARAKVAKATAELRNLYKTAKGDGFSKHDFDIGIELSTPEGEQTFKMRVASDLRTAQYVGAAIGNQFDMFSDFVDRTPIQERAYDEGQRASMEGKPLRCDYDPSTEPYREFARGWQDHQTSLLAGGIKQTEDKVETPAREPVTSGTAITRSEMIRQQKEKEAAAAAAAEMAGDDDGDGGFTRRTAH